MKNVFTLIFIYLCFGSFAQNAFDKALSEVSNDLADKLNQKGKKRIVVLFITDLNKSTTSAGKYVADILSVNIVNNPNNFEVFDRENLNSIKEAKTLKEEGYITIEKTKELGKILSVDAIIIGNYTVLSNSLKLTTKALDASTGFVIAAAMKDLPLDNDAGALLGINTSSSDKSNMNNNNRGFNNIPLNSNENYNNPETVNKECEKNNIGDYCFKNESSVRMEIQLYVKGMKYGDPCAKNANTMNLEPGETKCFYSLLACPTNYVVRKQANNFGQPAFLKYSEGQILIEKCKSKTQGIR